MRDGIPQIFIYIYTPLEYEFSSDNDMLKYNAINTASSIREYVKNNFSSTPNSTAMIIINGVVLGSLPVNKILSK